MTVAELVERYRVARTTDDFDVHAGLVKALLGRNDAETLALHYSWLEDRSNKDLNLRLRLAMIKRGRIAESFLLQMLDTEKSHEMRRDLLHMLGRLRSPQALKMARAEIASPDADMRHRACYVIGWMGGESEVALLRQVLLGDEDEYVRRTAATSHSQMGDRHPELSGLLIANMRDSLAAETSSEVLKWVIVTTQYLTKRKFGLRENVEEATVEGNVEVALARCRKFLDDRA